MAYTRVYAQRITWENEPSINTPLNDVNLNKMDYALNQIDGTLATWDTTKANQNDLLQAVKTITYDDETGQFLFTWWNGTTLSVDLNIEKIPVSFSMDANGVITMTTDDGTTYTADVGSLIKTYTFNDSGRIDFTVTTDSSGNKTVTADIVDGSITGSKLETNYLANCQAAQALAVAAQGAAETAAQGSEAWAVGTKNGTPVPSTDPTYHNNAKYWAEQANPTVLANMSDVDIDNPTDGQVLTYNSTTQKWENGAGGGGGGTSAEDVSYDNTTSGLTADNVQEAVDELKLLTDGKLSQTTYAKSGAVNYLNSVAVNTTSQGVTFTVDSDKRITANNQATGTAYCTILNGVTLKAGTYKLRGCPANGANNTYYIQIFGPNSVIIATDYGNGASFTLSADTVLYIYAYVLRGYTADNLVFEPMLTEVDYTGPYAPYAKTNKQLTDAHKITQKAVDITSGWTQDSTSQSGSTFYKKQITLNHIYVDSPTVEIGAYNAVLPTTAQQTTYDYLRYVTVDDTVPCIYLYADENMMSDSDRTSFYIDIEGVD